MQDVIQEGMNLFTDEWQRISDVKQLDLKFNVQAVSLTDFKQS